MKITTANIKNPTYNENHEIYVGTHTGSFKKINPASSEPHKQINLQTISALNKTSKITSLCWGEQQNEILIGRANDFVKIYDCKSNQFPSNVKMIGGPIVGLARYDGKLVAGIESGKIQIVAEPEMILETGDHMSRMRQCPMDAKLIATGGKGRQNNLKIWDLESGQKVFTTKNLPNDFLQLEIPVWDNDFGFLDRNVVSTCSRHGYLRTYDTRQQRRPIAMYADKAKEEMTYTCMRIFENTFYVGTATGIVRAFDARKLKTIMHTYKGFSGSVSDVCLDETGKYLFAACFDRFVRVFDSQTTILQYQCYVKSKATQILVRNATKSLDDDDEIDVKINLIESDDENEDNMKSNSGLEADPEFDELFENMPTVEDEDRPKTKKRKIKSTEKRLKKKK